MSARQLMHDTPSPGTPCARCGLKYSRKTQYVPCFLEGETKEEWKARVFPPEAAEQEEESYGSER